MNLNYGYSQFVRSICIFPFDFKSYLNKEVFEMR